MAFITVHVINILITIYMFTYTTLVAQWVEHGTINPRVMGLSPTLGSRTAVVVAQDRRGSVEVCKTELFIYAYR